MAILKERGADVCPVLPVLLELMGSPKLTRRLEGWATFLEGFPELRDQLGEYSPYETAEECQAKISSVRAALVRAGQFAHEGDEVRNARGDVC
jgi:hypothetical protein